MPLKRIEMPRAYLNVLKMVSVGFVINFNATFENHQRISGEQMSNMVRQILVESADSELRFDVLIDGAKDVIIIYLINI